MKTQLLGLDPATYKRHTLHSEERAWVETNCYVDLWIEVLHAWGLDPTASLAFTVGLDFEGDQVLFFKQPTGDLAELYGVDVQELNIWRSLLDHAVEQMDRGRLVMVELDAHYLPDTQGVTYGTGHSKTTIGIEQLDVAAKRLGYFHNAGYYSLSGKDFDGLFGIGGPPALLPPYTEFVKLDRLVRREPKELKDISVAQLRKHLRRRPVSNPMVAFAERFRRDLPWLTNEHPDLFHQYAFATLRQAGACYELAASYMRWLGTVGEGGLDTVAQDFESLGTTAKTIQFKMARAVMMKRPVDFEPMLEALATSWARAVETLDSRYT